MSLSEDDLPRLSPGNGFHLQEDGQWKAEKIPLDVLKNAEFSGYLTIFGYKSTVFDTPDGSSWAQKSNELPTKVSSSPLLERNDYGAGFAPQHSKTEEIVMTPNELAERLRKMATAIDNSKSPSRKRVAADLASLIRSLDSQKPEEK